MSWKTFLKAHWGAIAATDFFSVEVLRWRGLVRYFVLFVIDLKARRVEIAGIAQQPDGDWTKQIARNPTDAEEGFVKELGISSTIVIHCSRPRSGNFSSSPM